MPYIKGFVRDMFGPPEVATTPGELNYLFSQIANAYLAKNRLSYQSINDILGALEGAKLEFYRRVAVPYEDGKREANGDVYN